eukprot:8023208-Pyramimonas_sp.AAC.1
MHPGNDAAQHCSPPLPHGIKLVPQTSVALLTTARVRSLHPRSYPFSSFHSSCFAYPQKPIQKRCP